MDIGLKVEGDPPDDMVSPHIHQLGQEPGSHQSRDGSPELFPGPYSEEAGAVYVAGTGWQELAVMGWQELGGRPNITYELKRLQKN